MILQVRKPVVGFVEIFWMLIALIAMSGNPCFASIKIAVIGKTKNDSFYEQSFRGCEHFAKEYPTLECIYDGADDYQDVRTQVLIVEELVNKGVDGLLISTTDSAYLVNGALKQAKQAGIPVITFDSDLLPEHHAYRLAYVGTNNYDFGKALGCRCFCRYWEPKVDIGQNRSGFPEIRSGRSRTLCCSSLTVVCT